MECVVGVKMTAMFSLCVIVLVCMGHSTSVKTCKDKLSAYQCHILKKHGACTRNYRRAKFYCPQFCGFCGESCYKSKFGCCRDGETKAKGPNFYGCVEKCKDKFRRYVCKSIARAGFCGNQRYSQRCLHTCKLCRPCVDTNPKMCKQLVRRGQCEKYKPVTYNNCRKSCFRCDKKDPCNGVKCDANKNCRVDHEGKPYCACRRHCQPEDHYTGLLCGRDLKEYRNLCHLKHSNCDLHDPIEVKNYGKCPIVLKDEDIKKALQDGLALAGTCENTQYGCCIDGYSFAQGLKFEGCPKSEKCEDKSQVFCSRFRPDCNSSINRGQMRLFCPKTCFYCHENSKESESNPAEIYKPSLYKF